MTKDIEKIYKEPNVYVEKIKKELEDRMKIKKIFKSIVYSLIFILNLIVLILTTIALVEVLYEYNKSKGLDFVFEVLPTILVSLFSIFIFVFSIIVSIYENICKKDLYKETYRNILYEIIKYKSKENTFTKEEFEKKINEIYTNAIKTKKKSNYKKIIMNNFLGGEDD